MKVTPLELAGLKLIEPDYYADRRGGFYEAFSKSAFEQHGLPTEFVQDNVSVSSQGVVRGLHFQWPFAQGKLVWAVEGEIADVVVDIRKSSPTFGRHELVVLSAVNHRQLYVPIGFAHGFQAVSERAVVCYKCTERYSPSHEHTLLWNDPALGIAWPPPDHAVLSDKDAAGIALEAFDHGDLPD